MNLRAVLTAYRFQNKLSFAALGKEIGISRVDLYRFESGSDVSLTKMARILRWLLVDVPKTKYGKAAR